MHFEQPISDVHTEIAIDAIISDSSIPPNWGNVTGVCRSLTVEMVQ